MEEWLMKLRGGKKIWNENPSESIVLKRKGTLSSEANYVSLDPVGSRA